MKYCKFVFITLMLFSFTTTITAKEDYKAAKVYMFGLSESFNDSTVNFTDIQAVDAFVENNHTHFLNILISCAIILRADSLIAILRVL